MKATKISSVGAPYVYRCAFLRAAMIAMVVTAALGLCAGCGRHESEAPPATDEKACPPDAVSALYLVATVPACRAEEPTCISKCQAGDAPSCIAAAYALQMASKNPQESARLYLRACGLGAAVACTNYAAGIWARKSPESQSACALRTFKKACAAKEHYACGMVGRVMLESTSAPDYAEGRRYLEASCNDVGGFSCRVLAMHLESGKLGGYPPDRVRTLLTRACADGDPDACGEPKTATETFH